MDARVSRLLVHAVLATLVALAATLYQAGRKPPPMPVAESLLYLSAARDLADFAVFSGGGEVSRGDKPRPGAFFAPLYPAFVSLAMSDGGPMRATTDCVLTTFLRGQDPAAHCQARLGGVGVAQTGLAALSAVLVWWAAVVLCGRLACAWAAMAVALASGQYAFYVNQIMTENLLLPLFTAALLALVSAVEGKRRGLWVVTGVLFGLLVLTRPAFAYLVYACLVALGLAVVVDRRGRTIWGVGLVLVAAGYAVVVGPWLARNWLELGAPAVTVGYDGFILVQRLAYNAMTLREWLVSFLYWFPDFGDTLAKSLFPPSDWQRLTWDAPDSFYYLGNTVLRDQAVQAAGGPDQMFGHLVRSEFLPNLGKHVLVTLSLTWRGMWIAKYWGVIGMLALVPLMVHALRRRRRRRGVLIFAAGPLFMLGFHAFVSVNVARYNLVLIPVLSLAVAWCGGVAWARFGGRPRWTFRGPAA